VVSLGLLFYASPYFALRNLRQALSRGDSESLRDAIDFPAFRESLKEELGGQISFAATKELSKDAGPFAALGSTLVKGYVDTWIEGFVTPQSLAAIGRGKAIDSPPGPLAGLTDRLSKKSSDDLTVSAGYESFGRFCISVFVPHSQEPITLVMLRSGVLSWRLSAIRIPDLQELAKESNSAVSRSRAETQTPPSSQNQLEPGDRTDTTGTPASGEQAPPPVTADTKAKLAAAEQYLDRKEYAVAEGIYRQVVAAEPANVDALKGLASVLYREDKVDESAEVLDRIPKN
jgi:hypothetical protein